MSVAYGIDVQPDNDPYIAAAETAMHGMSEATIPGAFLVEFIPLLKYVPAWMPGADFKRKARMWRDFTTQVLEKPFAAVQQSLVRTPLRGSDTTVSAMNTFILAMVCHPEVQQKAQEELDSVLPPGQLPDFSDEPALPYLSAIVKEVLRWQPPVPLAVPHYATDDDIYDNYVIPAGSTVIGNAWTVYPNPHIFNPDRFMKDGKLNPEIRDPSGVFGFGRR
ncbi:hypothetical protein C0993_009238 [Termitomyces sp. T159_Od127]|nr:hypothetical protein C0993_009238 [Termitomyces sp. T159_Od127]